MSLDERTSDECPARGQDEREMHRTLRSAVLPGALLALLVACGSLVALAVVIGPGSAQQLPLSFGGRDATVTLRGSAVATASATRTQAAAPLLPERAQATITRRVSAGVAPKPADARADGARRPHTTLRGTAQHHSARRPAAAAPAPVAHAFACRRTGSGSRRRAGARTDRRARHPHAHAPDRAATGALPAARRPSRRRPFSRQGPTAAQRAPASRTRPGAGDSRSAGPRRGPPPLARPALGRGDHGRGGWHRGDRG